MKPRHRVNTFSGEYKDTGVYNYAEVWNNEPDESIEVWFNGEQVDLLPCASDNPRSVLLHGLSSACYIAYYLVHGKRYQPTLIN